MKIQGSHQAIRIISAYRPCQNEGPATVFSQHVRRLSSSGPCDPRHDILHQLHLLISEWMQNGDHIILCMDANEDTRSHNIQQFIHGLNLTDAILQFHSSSPPSTCDKNNLRQPIDAIWISPSLQPLQSGFLPFGYGCSSDHRILWLDIHQDIFLGNSPKLAKRTPRRLKASDPRIVDKYLQLLVPKLHQQGLLKDLQILSNQAHNHGWSSQLEEEYNRINQLQLQIRRDTERQLRKLRTGGIPWSPQLQRHRDTIWVLTLLIRKRSQRQVSNRLIRRILKRTDLTNAYHMSLAQLQQTLSQAFTNYKHARTQADSLRKDFLPSLAQARSERNNSDPDTELQNLLRIENQRRVARNVKRMRGKLGSPPTTQVYVTENGIRRLVTSKEDIEQVCIDENDARFSQSSDTPFMQSPMVDILGHLADTPAAQQILDGSFIVPPEIDLYTRKMIRELRMPHSIQHSQPISSSISVDEHISSWRKQKESTASDSISGISFSHYIAGTHNQSLTAFDATIRSLPYEFGFSPQPWQTISDVEILKKAGVYDIEKM